MTNPNVSRETDYAITIVPHNTWTRIGDVEVLHTAGRAQDVFVQGGTLVLGGSLWSVRHVG